MTRSAILFVATVLVAGCMGRAPSPPENAAAGVDGPAGIEARRAAFIAEWSSPADDGAGDDTESSLRSGALVDAALAAGAQAGHAERVREINARLGERMPGGLPASRRIRESDLDQVFDFGRVAIALPSGRGWILPPVILRSEGAWTGSADGQAAASAARWYAIARPGRIVPDVPNWRDWLWLEPGEMPPVPPEGLRPRDSDERERAAEALARGWEAGIAQADEAFRTGLARLERDFAGMLEYHVLVDQKIITELVLSDNDLGILASADGTELRIGTRKLTIVSPAAFGGAWEEWRAVPVTGEDAERAGS